MFPSHGEILRDFGFSDVDGRQAEMRPAVAAAPADGAVAPARQRAEDPMDIVLPGRSMFRDMMQRMDNMMDGFRDISRDMQAQMVSHAGHPSNYTEVGAGRRIMSMEIIEAYICSEEGYCNDATKLS